MCLSLFISPMEFYQGVAVADFAHPGFGTGRELAHTTFLLTQRIGFLMKYPTILGPDGGVPWVYPQRSNPQLGQGAGFYASGYRHSEKAKELNRCDIKGRRIEPE